MNKLLRALAIGLLSLTASLAPDLALANHRLCRIYVHDGLSQKAPATSEQGLAILDQLALRLNLDIDATQRRSKALYVFNDRMGPEERVLLSEHFTDLRDDLEIDRAFHKETSLGRRKHPEVKVTINLLKGKAAIDEYNRSYLRMAKVLKQYISPSNNRAKTIRVGERLARMGMVGTGLWLWFKDLDLIAFAGEALYGEQDLEVLLDSGTYAGFGIGLITLASIYPVLKKSIASMRKLAPGGQAFVLPPAKVFKIKVKTSEDILFESHSERGDNVPWIGPNMHAALDRISYRNEDGTPEMLIISRMVVARR